MMEDTKSGIIADGIADNKAIWEEQKKSIGEEWKDKRFNKKHGYSFWLAVNAVRMFPRGTELPKDITPYYCGLMYRCANMLQANTNAIVKRYANYERTIDTGGLAEELRISVRCCQQFLKAMAEKRIIKKRNGRIYINPIFFMCGKYLSWELYTLFQEDLDAFLPQWVIDRFNGDDKA